MGRQLVTLRLSCAQPLPQLSLLLCQRGDFQPDRLETDISPEQPCFDPAKRYIPSVCRYLYGGQALLRGYL